MSEDSHSVQDIKKQVEARVAEEEQSAPPAVERKDPVPSIDFLRTCLFGNRVGDATLFAYMFRGKFVFIDRWDRWLRWGGHYWQEDINPKKALAAVERVCEQYQRILTECPDAGPRSELVKEVRRRLNHLRNNGRKELLECAATIDDPLFVDDEKLDKQEYLLACPNGVIDLRTGVMSPGQPEQYILNACPIAWKGLNPSHDFYAFLRSCFDNDEEMVRYILRLLGYGLLGNRNEAIWVIFHGPRGRNGKDTLMKLLGSVLGKTLVRKVNTAMLLQQTFQRSSSQPEPDIMALRGAKFAYASEAESNQKIAIAKLKDLTGNSELSARGLQDPHISEWVQSHLLFLLTNELPKMKADDDAFWSRLHAVHWPIRFVDNPLEPDERKRDPRMMERLEQDLPGVLACLVLGCMDYLANGLQPPEKVLAYTKEQRDNFDDIGQFLNEACNREATPPAGADWRTRTSASDFVATCNWWLKQNYGNTYNYSAKRITQTLEKKGISSRKSNVMQYLGVEVKAEVRAEYAAAVAEEERKSSRGRY